MKTILNWYFKGVDEVGEVTQFRIIGLKAFEIMFKNIPQIIITLIIFFILVAIISLPLFLFTFLFLN